MMIMNLKNKSDIKRIILLSCCFSPVVSDHCSSFPLCSKIMTGKKDPEQPKLNLVKMDYQDNIAHWLFLLFDCLDLSLEGM